MKSSENPSLSITYAPYRETFTSPTTLRTSCLHPKRTSLHVRLDEQKNQELTHDTPYNDKNVIRFMSVKLTMPDPLQRLHDSGLVPGGTPLPPTKIQEH